MQTRLIVNDGPMRGTVAPIKIGHYLVGRHAECQIRPESSRVSRRHCLIWNDGKKLGVMDLSSSWGTYVNDVQLRPEIWKVLCDGDRLRVGDFSFEVSIAIQNQNPVGPTASNTATATITTPSVRSADHLDKGPSRRALTGDNGKQKPIRRSPGKPSRQPRPKRSSAKRTLAYPSFSDLDSEHWRLIAVSVIVAGILILIAYQVYEMQSFSDLPVRPGLD